MNCERCGKEVDRGWRFCPNCGSSIQRPSRSLFDDIFSRFRREFGEMDSMFDKEFEVLDLTPFIKRMKNQEPGMKRKGFTIKITRRNNEQPKVDVKTFGDMNRNEVNKEVRERMRQMVPAGKQDIPKPAPSGPARKREHPEPKVMEEPKTDVKRLGDRLVVEMHLPDVKEEQDIEVDQLESSVEVKARAGDKAYFKIITKPHNMAVTSRKFEKGKLHLEFS